VAVGGALGTLCRWWLGQLWPQRPLVLLAINTTGAFALGLLHPLLRGRWARSKLRLASTVGFLGGYTTFSAWLFRSTTRWEDGARLAPLLEVLGGLLLGIGAAAAGLALGRWTRGRGAARRAACIRRASHRRPGTPQPGQGASRPA
jgi:CrcB protein